MKTWEKEFNGRTQPVWQQLISEHNGHSPSATSTGHPSPSAIILTHFGGLPYGAVQTLTPDGTFDSHILLSSGSLHISIHSYSGTRAYQEAPEQITSVPHPRLLPPSCISSPIISSWLGSIAPANMATPLIARSSLGTKKLKCPGGSCKL